VTPIPFKNIDLRTTHRKCQLLQPVTMATDGHDSRCRRSTTRNTAFTAKSPSPSIYVPTRKRLAVLWLHGSRSGRRPEDIRVRCKTSGTAILRLKKLDVDSIRYLVAAAVTYRLHCTAMRGAQIHALELMNDAVVAITKTQSTEAERRAPSRSNLTLYQRRSQRPPG
jgi:hypothetical protein